MWGRRLISLRPVWAERNHKLMSSVSVRPTDAYYSRAFTTLNLDTAAGRHLALLSAELADMAEAITPCPERSAHTVNELLNLLQ